MDGWIHIDGVLSTQNRLCMVVSHLSTDSSLSTAVSRAGRTVALSTGGRAASKHASCQLIE